MSNTPVNNEYQIRLRMGFLMALAVVGVLVVDHFLQVHFHLTFYPCLILAVLILILVAGSELHAMLSALPRPPLWLTLLAACAVALSGCLSHAGLTGATPQPWRDVVVACGAVVLLGFLWEMFVYKKPGEVVERLSLLMWMTAYLGLLPAFFVQLRYLPPTTETSDIRGIAALTLAIFVPKGADIGAYVAGRALGRNRMTPLLSPKKTWEGLTGGLLLAALISVGVQLYLVPMFRHWFEAALFGLVIGTAGVLGDLAESLIKRDRQAKDASQAVPGFGGILDVVDSVLFAALPAWLWLSG